MKNFWIISIILSFAFVANNVNEGTRGVIQQLKKKVEYLKDKPSIVFLITKDSNNYEADKTIPVLAEMLRKQHGYDVTVLLGEGDHGSYRYPSMETLSQADLLI